jgi:hypothetical protein
MKIVVLFTMLLLAVFTSYGQKNIEFTTLPSSPVVAVLHFCCPFFKDTKKAIPFYGNSFLDLVRVALFNGS